MDELQSRLTRCFLAVLPELNENDVRIATPASVSSWDSVTTLNLITVMEEEFGLQIDFVDLMESLSFDLILKYLNQRLAANTQNDRCMEARGSGN